MYLKSLLGGGLLCLASSVSAWQTPADSTSVLSFTEAKSILMKENLRLLAAYYEINIAEALLIQAKVWNNPYFILNQDMYSNEKNKYFLFTEQQLLQVEQIFSVAGKHTNTVKLAKISVEMSGKQMEDVLRTLLLELGNTYNELAALQEKETLFTQVLVSYERLMEATRKQLDVGAISVMEALRLESEFVALKAQAVQNYNNMERAASQLRILLRLPQDTTVKVELRVPLVSQDFEVQTLIEVALEKRPDLAVKKINKAYQERNVKLQKSLSVPDIKFAYQPRDRGSNYVRPYQGFNVEVPMPLFDRNQGRIKASEYTVKRSEMELAQLDNQVRNQVLAAYNRYKSANLGLSNYSDQFLNKMKELNQNTNLNFQKRNISLLEFIDQQRIFILTNTQLIELKQQFLNNVNELNFSVGTFLIEY